MMSNQTESKQSRANRVSEDFKFKFNSICTFRQENQFFTQMIQSVAHYQKQ